MMSNYIKLIYENLQIKSKTRQNIYISTAIIFFIMKRGLRVLLILTILSIFSLQLVYAQCTDEDGDGYTIEGGAGCTNPGVADCADNEPNINPGASEVSGNGLDDNCDGIVDTQQCTDSDVDGYNVNNGDAACVVNGVYDCDDSTATVNPGKAEVAGDGIDNNCNGQTDEGGEAGVEELGEEEAGCTLNAGLWYDCDGNEISTANEGDSVFAVVEANNCPEDSTVTYDVKKSDGSVDVATLTSSHVLSGAPKYFSAKWDAQSDGVPTDYLFDAELGISTVKSGQLTVSPCETSGCEVTCDAPAGFSSIGGGGGGGSSGPLVVCRPSWDCSQAVWSECDQDTGKKTRDISLCTFTGTAPPGDEHCPEEGRELLKEEEDCLAGAGRGTFEETQRPSRRREEPEKKKFPWLFVALGGLLLLLVGGGVAYYLIKKKKVAAGAQLLEKSPFENPNDLNSVMNYIKLSKQRNVPDDKVVEMLKKSGWKDEQIKYAWIKLAQQLQQQKPGQSAQGQQSNAQATQQKPATQQPGQQSK